MILPKPNIRRETMWPYLLAGTITVCSGFAAVHVEIDWFAPDKVAHFFVYGALATAAVRHSGLKNWPLLGAWWAILLALAYGLGDEYRQGFTIVRLFEWDDWLADTLGAITAVVLYLRWEKYRRLLEKPVFKREKKNQTGLTTEHTEHTEKGTSQD